MRARLTAGLGTSEEGGGGRGREDGGGRMGEGEGGRRRRERWRVGW